MIEDRPPTYEELAQQNAALIADNQRLRDTIRSLQSTMIRMDAELARAKAPKREPRKLDPAAKDSFSRPFR
jgi:hypothetical protein